MAIGYIDDSSFHDIADAIRAKGVSGTFTPAQMADAIGAISVGADIPQFEVTWYDDWSDVKEITCNMTYSECHDLSQSDMRASIFEHDESYVDAYYTPASHYRNYSSYIVYMALNGSYPLYDLHYNSDGSISFVSASAGMGTEGTPTATKGSVSNHSVSVTPSVTNTAGYIAGGTKTGTAVTVSASELVSGSETKTANGTYDVTNLASLVVNVSGGASNVVIGSFTADSETGVAHTVSIPYTGSGYPIAALVFVAGGVYNSGGQTDWYNSVQRYAVGQWTYTKSVQTSTPTYGTSGTQNQGVTTWVYKNSTSTATTYSRSSAMNTNVLTSSNATGAGATCVRFTANSGKTLSYFTASTSYGLLAGITYTYIIVYSS